MTEKKKISIIGSTGQIGKQTVDIIKNSKNFKISLISCEKDIKTLSDQIKNQKPVKAKFQRTNIRLVRCFE